MKTFRIPLIDTVVSVYSGPGEWAAYAVKVNRNSGEPFLKSDACPGRGSGRAYGSWVWVYNLGDRVTLLHELSHFFDDLLDHLHSRDSEFRAYLSSVMIDRVLKWAESIL